MPLPSPLIIPSYVEAEEMLIVAARPAANATFPKPEIVVPLNNIFPVAVFVVERLAFKVIVPPYMVIGPATEIAASTVILAVLAGVYVVSPEAPVPL